MNWKELRTTVLLAATIVLHGCGGNLVAPSQVTVGSPNALRRPNGGVAKTMSIQFGRELAGPKLVKIFDNLAGRPSGTYWGGSEVVIAGGNGNSTFPDNQLAGAFTPRANHTATVIELAAVNSGLGYGSSGFTLSLNADNNGAPGSALLTAQLPGLPNNGLGLCCALVIGRIPSGEPLQKGKQYWLVLSGQSGQPSDAAAWDMNATDQLHPFLDAAYCAYATGCSNGVGWHTFSGTPFGTGIAFAVLGS